MWQACRVHADQPVPAHRLALVLDGRICGWVDPDTTRCLLQPPTLFELSDGRLTLAGGLHDSQVRSEALHWAARRLYQGGIVRAWRSEQLDVWSDDGRSMAVIERAACRALGVETRSVQLNGFRPDRALVVARRAAHKLSDPDRWDNLAGGMIAAGEEDHQALAREAYEEAGLQLAQQRVARGSRFRVQRMVAEGLMIETVQVFDVQLPADFVPANLDGEVAGFQTLAVGAAVDAIERGDFTLQASMAILDALRRGLPRGESGTNKQS